MKRVSKNIRLSNAQMMLCDVLLNVSAEENKKALSDFIHVCGEPLAFSLAQENQVTSVIAHKMMWISDQFENYSRWFQEHECINSRLSAYLAELDRIADRLAKEDIPLVALKNSGIARGIYPCLGCCPMGDLDVLVTNRHFRKAHNILLENGYHFEFRSPLEEVDLRVAEKTGGAEYWKILPNGEKLWLELQWRPVAGRWIRSDQEPSTEELMARSIAIAGTNVRLLSPEDNLLQVALHTAKHSYVRAPGFRLHLDVERIVRAYPDLDWEHFVQRVKTLQVKTAVYFSLLIPYELFGTPIPADVLSCLRPHVWKKRLIINWLNRVGLFNPHERKFSKSGYIFFNALLYDDLRGLFRAIFPDRTVMQQWKGVNGKGALILAHMRRIRDLTFRRINT
jgi:hypothetical protein